MTQYFYGNDATRLGAAQAFAGYLWLATNGGLVRFDGARFVVFDRSAEGIRLEVSY